MVIRGSIGESTTESLQKKNISMYLAAQGWSLHCSGGGFGFPTLRQRLSLTGVWLLSRMHFRIVERMPISKDIANSSNDMNKYYAAYLEYMSQVFLFSWLIKIFLHEKLILAS